MKSACRRFILEIEDLLDRGSACDSARDSRVPQHAHACASCGDRWRAAQLSRRLLAGIEPPNRTADPYFWTRLQARLHPVRLPRWSGVGAKARDWAMASALFAATLGLFVYNIKRTEVPNANEAMALDVPHLNA